jgi:hypothetical protein
MDNEQNRIDAEKGRVTAEDLRVQAEAGRAHAESNEGSGRVEAEEGRVVAEEERRTNAQKFDEEIRKFQADPDHYVSPGAHRILRKFTYAWVLLAIAAVVGVYALTNESKDRVNDINKSRALITYTGCLDQNNKHDSTILQLDRLLIVRKSELRKQIKAAEEAGNATTAASLRGQIDRLDDSRSSTVSLIDALAPRQNCDQLVLDRFGFVPDTKTLGGE